MAEEYAIPANTGPGSDRRACQKVIKQVLDVLAYPDQRFDMPKLPSSYAWDQENEGVSFEHDCKMFRMRLFQRLKASGWELHHDEYDLIVKAPK